MAPQISNSARVSTIVLALLLCLPVAAFAINGTSNSASYLNGTVQSLNRDLNYVTIRDDASGRNVKIDVRDMDTRQSINVWNLHPGDRVGANGGWENNDTFKARNVSFSTANTSTYGAYNNANTVVGTVTRVNRDLNYITVRDQNTGRDVRIDVRQMDTRQSVNVWRLREGDQVVAYGGWSGNARNRFQANTVNFANQSMTSTSSYGTYGTYPNGSYLSGVVQSTNRELNYITVRDNGTGQLIKIDVRNMNTDRSVNVWRLRAGDRITVNGGWENRDTFQASSVNF